MDSLWKTGEKHSQPYELDGRPPLKVAIPLGLQHVLAMFVGNLTPLLIITAAAGSKQEGIFRLHYFRMQC